jgi:hypothetical protein
MKRCLLAVLAVVVVPGLLLAQPPAPPATPMGPTTPVDSWRQAPYHLTLVLHVDPHPLLTPVFVARLRDEVRDALQRDLGAICTVDVLTDHPLLQDILERGWGTLDNRKFTVDDNKLHFLRVNYDNGQYTIQGRQVDGSTALVSPLRKVHTPDRLWVSRLCALTAAQDFGMVAQVGKVDLKTIQLLIKGTGKEDPESVKIRVGDVFALAEVRQGSDGKPQGLPVPDAYLVISDVRPGECTGRLFSRYKDPIKQKPDRQSLGYRALKLGTQRAPLQLRVVDAITKEPLPGCGVKVFPSGFEALQAEELTTNAQGRVRSKDTYKNVVFVQLSIAGVKRAEVPFPLLSDLPIEYPLSGSQEADALARLDYRNRQWNRQVREFDLSMDIDAGVLRDITAKSGDKAAVEKCKEIVAKQQGDLTQLVRDLEEVRDAGQGAPQQLLDGTIARGQKAIAALRNKAKAFEEFITDIDNPAKIAAKNGRLAEKAYDAPTAIAAYEQSLKLEPDEDVSKRLARVRKAWQLKGGPNDAHAQARKYINDTWGTLEGEALEKGLPIVKNHFKAVQDSNGDIFTAYKLYKVSQEHLQKLTALRDQIGTANAEDAAERIDAINKLGEAIQTLNEEVAAWIDAEQQKP